MTHFSASLLRVGSVVILCFVLAPLTSARAQEIEVGASLFNGGNVNPTGVETILNMIGANFDGPITTVTFGWSASPCPAAATIKFFRPVGVPTSLPPFAFVTAQGPFDVVAPVSSGFAGSFATQTVNLNPPVNVRAGDLIAITNRTTCGGPVYANWDLLAPPPLNFTSLTVPGDVTSTVTGGTFGSAFQSIFLAGTGTGPASVLLGNRFLVTLTATDPRTGVTADGVGNNLGCCGMAGYFSLPSFTGDPTFPEVTVKIVDATGSPALGGDFWFFHAPLTDVRYTLTVTDQTTGAVKTYSNSSGSPGQLCGGVDTSAFPGP